MISKAKIKVFYEPVIDKHPADLYISELIATPVPFTYAATRDGHTKYDIEGFLVVDGVLNEEEVTKGKSELQSMTSADDPHCEAIWYEGGISQLLPDATTEKKMIGKGVGDALALGRQDTQLPDLPGHLRAPYVRKFMGFLDAHADLHAIAYHPKLLALVETILEAKPELFQEMAMIKPPGGREKPWHQDHACFNYDLETRIVGVWIPLGTSRPRRHCLKTWRRMQVMEPTPTTRSRTRCSTTSVSSNSWLPTLR